MKLAASAGQRLHFLLVLLCFNRSDVVRPVKGDPPAGLFWTCAVVFVGDGGWRGTVQSHL